MEEGEEIIIRVRSGGKLQENNIFQTYAKACVNAQTLLAACARTAQTKSQSHIEEGKWMQSPTPAKEIFAIDSFWRLGEPNIFNGVTVSLSTTLQKCHILRSTWSTQIRVHNMHVCMCV